MKKNSYHINKKSGVSMITLVITIIIIIILAGMFIGTNNESIDTAGRSAFFQELSDVETRVAEKRMINQKDGVEEEDINKSFLKSYIENPPKDFVSFDDDAYTGYVVDINTISLENSNRGLDYAKYSTFSDTSKVVFGESDVYIYDATGKVFYAKGYASEESVYYTANDILEEGPKIVSTSIKVSDDKKSANLTIGVSRINDGELSVFVSENETELVSENSGVFNYKIKLYENKVYEIVATEEGAGTTTKLVEVTGIVAETYTVTFNANGGTNAPASQTKTENVVMKLTKDEPTKEGMYFTGWSESATSTYATYLAGGEFALNKDTTLYAVWKSSNRTYDLIYSANGGNGAPEAVKGVKTATISSTQPTREGYAFQGWSENAKMLEGEYKAGDSITLEKNLVLYASWKKVTDGLTVSIYMKVEDDETAVSPGTVVGNGIKSKGRTVVITANANSGFVFKKWSVTSSNVKLENANSTTTSFTMPSEDVSIDAIFERTEVTLKYDANKGNKAPSSVKSRYGQTVTVASETPQRTGYTFKGWSLENSKSATVKYKPGDTFTIYNNTTLYAVWEIKVETYSIKYDLQGGVGSDGQQFADQEKVKGIPINIYSAEPTREYFSFAGWALAASATKAVYASGEQYTKDADVTLYAVWIDEIAPTITLTPIQSGDDTILKIKGEDEGKIVAYAWGTSGTVPTSWTSITPNKVYEAEKVLDAKGDVCIWMKDTAGNYSNGNVKVYEISYDKNGGVGGTEHQYKVHGTSLTATKNVPTKEGYIFAGWTISGVVGSTVYETIDDDMDLTLRATWGASYFTLSESLVNLEIDGESKNVTVTKNDYTGRITLQSTNENRATASIEDNVITIKPGTEIGEVSIIVTENSASKYSQTIYVLVERGTRKITLDETSKEFTYGDSSANVGFYYSGNIVTPKITSTNSDVAIASVNGTTITITPKGAGDAVLTLTFDENDMYLQSTATISVKVNKKAIVVTPKAGQGKIYDGTATTPELEYTHTGEAFGEEAGFTGSLVRDIGSDAGQYLISFGTNNLQLADNGTFKKKNYYLTLNGKVYFTISPKEVDIPEANEGLVYDGTTKYGIPDGGTIYTRKGDYAKIEAGTYTALADLKDSKNYIWKDGTQTSQNIEWKISGKAIGTSEITISEIADATYTGNYITPNAVVTDTTRGVILTKDKDYTLTYKNNLNVGTAIVTVNGKGNYSGSKDTTFNIKKANMNVAITNYNEVYDNEYHSIDISVTWPSTGATIYYSTTKLDSSNYTSGSTSNLKYIDAISSQTVYFYIIANNFNDYAGSGTVTIARKNITSNVTLSNIKDYEYTGSSIIQTPTLYDEDLSKTLVNGTDYELSYSNNLYPGTATATITGVGNYTGTKSASFTVEGDKITFAKSTESLTSSLTVTISKSISATTLQYSYNNSSWSDYTAGLTITSDCTVYARSMHNDHVIGTASLSINNICEHSWVAATCTVDSYCKLCNEVKNNSKLGHDFSSKDTTATYLCSKATCTAAATYYYKCSRCTEKGTSTYASGNALGHNYSSQTATATYLRSSATCTAAATYYYKCSRCSSKGTNYYSYGSALGHNYGSWYTVKAATCTASGINRQDCSRCSAYNTSSTSALGHNWGSWTVVTSATCTAAGSQKRTCSRCSTSETQTISALGHSYSAATCTTPKTCTRCGTTSGSALGHLTTGYSWDLSGYHWQTCKRCATVVTKEAHTAGSRVSYDNSTYHYIQCSICGFYYTTESHSFTGSVCLKCGQTK